MKTITTQTRPACGTPLCSALLLCLASSAWSATPDAGSLLREEVRRDQPVAPAMPPKPTSAASSPASNDVGPKMLVTAFRVTGLKTVSEVAAQTFFASFANQTFSMDGLHAVAAKFEQWLRGQGLFTARAYVPPQDIRDGVVEIRVLEGHLEGIDIKRAPDTRVGDEPLRALLAGALPAGAALEQKSLERGLLLMNDWPATSARAVLVPGAELGGSRVVVEAAQGPVLARSVELDNTGNRFTGDWRLGAALSVNDPSGRGDQWSLRAAASQGSNFVRAGYAVPLGHDGWKVGATLIGSRYQLCCDAAVTALDANGAATALSGFVSYPLLRARMRNVTVSANWANRSFVNRSLGVVTSDKTSSAATLGLNGDHSIVEGLGGLGAYTTWSLQWVSGRLNLDSSAADRAQDATTAQSHGSFDKWSGQVSHLMRWSKSSALYAGLSGQAANKNLDSSEKFTLGGPQGVRAYPTGEASGDEGWLLNLEWRSEIDRQWGWVAFVDHGSIGVHHTPWLGWNAATPTLDNHYTLSGVGASVVWTPAPGRQVTATLATRLGENPARDAAGQDSDSRSPQPRLWLTGSMAF